MIFIISGAAIDRSKRMLCLQYSLLKQPQLLKFPRAELLECLEVNWGMKWRPLVVALNTLQVVFLKAVRVQALKLQVAAAVHNKIMMCMFINASSVKIRLSNWREKLLNQRERQQN